MRLKQCKAVGKTCMKCEKGDIRKPPEPIQRIDQKDESSKESVVEDDELVLTIYGDENGQFTKSGKCSTRDLLSRYSRLTRSSKLRR